MVPSLELSSGDALWVVHPFNPYAQDVLGVASDGAGGAIVLTLNHRAGPMLEEHGTRDELEVSRYDVSGWQAWSRPIRVRQTFQGLGRVEGGVLAVSPRGDVFVAGQVRGDSEELLLGDQRYGMMESFLAKFSADGELRWVRPEAAQALAADGQGGVVTMVRGGTVKRLDAGGCELWTWRPTQGEVFALEALAADAEGGVVVAGHKVLGEGVAQGHLVRLSAGGSVLWRRGTSELEGRPTFTDVAFRPDGGVLLTGTFPRDFTWGGTPVRNACLAGPDCNRSVFLLTASPEGTPQWGRSLAWNQGSFQESEPRLAASEDGGAVVSWGDACVSYLGRVTSGGDEVWRRQASSAPCESNAALPRDIAFLKDGSLLRAGWFKGTRALSGGRVVDGDVQDLFLMRLAP
jgi:hypothetical protein